MHGHRAQLQAARARRQGPGALGERRLGERLRHPPGPGAGLGQLASRPIDAPTPAPSTAYWLAASNSPGLIRCAASSNPATPSTTTCSSGTMTEPCAAILGLNSPERLAMQAYVGQRHQHAGRFLVTGTRGGYGAHAGHASSSRAVMAPWARW